MKKKQHTVPSGYLKGFGNKPNGRKTQLFMLNIKTGKSNKTQSDSVTTEKDFYTIFSENGERNLLIEDFFSNTIEKTIPIIIGKIQNQESLNEIDKKNLSEFITFQDFRSKSRRDLDGNQDGDFLKLLIRCIFENLNNETERLNSLKRTLISQYNYIATEVELKDYIKRFKKGQDIYFSPRRYNMRKMLSLAPEMAKVIQKKQWFFFYSKNRPFITSDYPIYLHPNGDGTGFYSSPGYLTAKYIGFPLSKNCYMIIGDLIKNTQDPIISELKDLKIIKKLNLQTAYGTNLELIGCNEDLLISINKQVTKLDAKYDESKL